MFTDKSMMNAEDSQKSSSSKPTARKEGSEPFSAICFCITFVTMNTVIASNRPNQDTVMFTVIFYMFLMLLLCSGHLMEKLPQDSKLRETLKAVLWVSSTLVLFLVPHNISRVSGDVWIAYIGWVLAGVTNGVTFYVYFVYSEDEPKHTGHADGKIVIDECF